MNVDIVTDVNNEKENESNKVEVEETVPTEAEYSKSFSFQKFMGKVTFDDVSSIFVQKHIGVDQILKQTLVKDLMLHDL